MRDLDDTALERRLREVLEERLGALPLELTVDALDRRQAKRAARRVGRGRGITLLAAALLLAGGALAVGAGLLRRPAVVPPLPSPSVVAIATSPDATSPSPSGSAPSASPTPVAGPGGVWIPTGSMGTPRYRPDTVRLLDGRVLVLGGGDDSEPPTAELYDPATGTWSPAATTIGVGDFASFTALRDGRVLAVGGDGAAVYDPAGGTWTATAKRVKGADLLCYGVGERCEGFGPHHATLLADGKVLVTTAGGAQLYDPDSGTWTATGKMHVSRLNRDAVILLSDGKVLVAGGRVAGEYVSGELPATDAAEVYDPVTNSWTQIADMRAPLANGFATQLPDGKVLLYAQRPEVYDPTTGTWTAPALPTQVVPGPWAVLSDGTLLTEGTDALTEGNDPNACIAALFDPQTWSLTATASMLRCDNGSSFTLLLDGTVLRTGGRECDSDGVTEGTGGSTCVSTSAAELYVPAGVPMPPLPAFPSPAPPVFPGPTPVPTPLPPADGPVPPHARRWTITVDNRSSQPATMWVTDGDKGTLVGSATPNVVPAGTKMNVTFLLPADGGWIDANLRPGEGGGLLTPDQVGIPGKMVITPDGDTTWVSPAG